MSEQKGVDERGRMVRTRGDMNYGDTPRVSVEDYLEAWSNITMGKALKALFLYTTAILAAAAITAIVAALAGWRP